MGGGEASGTRPLGCTRMSDSRPVLSVLMPVYDERATVEQAIEEVLGADLPLAIELVIVDDGSTDGTSELLAARAPDPRVRIVQHPANRGKGAAVITALAHASGEYAAIMDAD